MKHKNLIKDFLKYLLDIQFFNGRQFIRYNDLLITTLQFFAKHKIYSMFKLLIKTFKCRLCFSSLFFQYNNIWKIDLPIIIKSDINMLKCQVCFDVSKRLKKLLQKYSCLSNTEWVIVISQNPNPTNPSYDSAEYRYGININFNNQIYNIKFQIGTVFGLGHLLHDLDTNSKIPPVLGLLIKLGLWPKYNLYFTDAIKCNINISQQILNNCWNTILEKEIRILMNFCKITKIILLGGIALSNKQKILNMGFNNNDIICLYHPQGQATNTIYKRISSILKSSQPLPKNLLTKYQNIQSELNKLNKSFKNIDGFWDLTI